MVNTKTFGYVRVSSADQNVDRQIHKMLELGIDERDIFIDKASGKNFDRPNYQALKRVIREGDLIYIDALDRLGRNYDDIIKEWKEITREISADIVILENQTLFDSRKFKEMGDAGKLMEDQFLSLLSYVADQERKKILKRQAEGIEAARKKGKHLGRPRITLETLSQKQLELLEKNYMKWKNNEITANAFMKLIGLKRNTFYKIMREYEIKK
ncbi:recombinase family protein [Calidifontibacillus erzurumensis]|uniref:Recombinase family protein n=1 Tax=Calidifontibacillus erzurumensis TaxID=2741433 RepID=A0A8J8GHI9_9BACI|nr:recombinase family protein [Calidifontibacillus erzurumensis]NSL53291.1 recombinase family protein [Calidifontibacillus erzurumensis]